MKSNKKTLKSLLMVFVFLLKPFAGFSQPTRLLLSSGRVNSSLYHVYEPSVMVRNGVSSQNTTIEGLMAAILGADTQVKLNGITLGGARNAEQKTAQEFDKIKKRNIDKTYFELISSLEMESTGQYFAIVKFRLHLEEIPKGISGAYQLQKVGNRWYKTSRTDLSNIALMMIFFKPNILENLIKGQSKNEPLLEELLKKTYDNEGLNFKKLYQEFISWETDKQRKGYFLEPTGW